MAAVPVAFTTGFPALPYDEFLFPPNRTNSSATVSIFLPFSLVLTLVCSRLAGAVLLYFSCVVLPMFAGPSYVDKAKSLDKATRPEFYASPENSVVIQERRYVS